MAVARRNGLVLSGGGARGAYEVGVLLYLREHYPKRFGKQLRFDVITGTSVGALNGSFLAATANDLDNQAQRLANAWRGLEIESLISLKAKDLWRATKLLFGAESEPPKPGMYRYGGLLDTRGLERFVTSFVPWRGIHSNIKSGHLDGVAISATHVGSGHTVVFIDAKGGVPPWSHNPFVRPVASRITPRHALASAAIPVLFPAVKVGKAFYVDGGLRANTPMSPAIRLGADRLLVISLRHKANKVGEEFKAAQHEADYPKPLFLLGKALNALLLDPTEHDLERMERINAILRAGRAAYGDSFTQVIGSIQRLGSPLRELEAVHIQPSVDIGEIAADVVTRGGPKLVGRVARKLLRSLAAAEAQSEADVLSYLLFDGGYAEELLELGYEDARAQEEELFSTFAP